MRAETSARRTEVATILRNRPRRYANWFRFGGDIEDSRDLPAFLTLIPSCLADQQHEIFNLAELLIGELGERHVQHRSDIMRAYIGGEIHSRDHRIAQVLFG